MVVLIRYEKKLAEDFILGNPSLTVCPAPDCGKAVLYPKGSSRDVRCACGHDFCFGCGQGSHAPLSCIKAEEWRKKEVAEDETVKYLKASTKPCPRYNLQDEHRKHMNEQPG